MSSTETTTTTTINLDDEPDLKELLTTNFKDGDDNLITNIISIRTLSKERIKFYSKYLPKEYDIDSSSISNTQQILSIQATNDYDEIVDYIVKLTLDPTTEKVISITNCLIECKIMYELMSPTQIIEYTFDEDPNEYILSCVSLPALESYRKSKYKLWLDMMYKPTCEAQFRRMIKIGLINKIFDDQVFPTINNDDRKKYEVVDENSNKIVKIPHPVHTLRIWNSEEQKYNIVQSHLEGSPIDDDDVKKTWNELMEKFKVEHGEEYINNLLSS